MTRVMSWLTGVLGDRTAAPEVHFHQGPEARPAVCFDERCRRPRLDV